MVSILFGSVLQKWFESTRKKEGLGGLLVIGKETCFFPYLLVLLLATSYYYHYCYYYDYYY